MSGDVWSWLIAAGILVGIVVLIPFLASGSEGKQRPGGSILGGTLFEIMTQDQRAGLKHVVEQVASQQTDEQAGLEPVDERGGRPEARN